MHFESEHGLQLPRLYIERLQALYEWGCKAANPISSSIEELPVFTKSWGAKQHILYYQKSQDGQSFSVFAALPCINMLLKEIAETLSQNVSIPDVSIVLKH